MFEINEQRLNKQFTVSEINRYINEKLKYDLVLMDLWIKGEISNFRPHYSGHLYFTLKDSSSTLKCVMFKGAASKLRFAIENGMKVLIRGSISVFERDGQYQLYCEEIKNDGVGDLYLAYEQLKKKLEEQGLFDAALKKTIPMIPGSVCVITSPTGSVVKDIINVSLRRFPKANIKIFPVQVQGETAAPQIAKAIRKVNALSIADLIIVGRGGGSIEDLWAFNEEIVARAIFDSTIPIISAVGHETDFTICDFVADLRAPTPSAAAELAFPDMDALLERIFHSHSRLKSAFLNNVERKKRQLDRCTNSTVFTKPLFRLEHERMRLNGVENRLFAAVQLMEKHHSSKLALLSAKLDSLSPLKVLARGYAIVSEAKTGKIVHKIADVSEGDPVKIRLSEGSLECTVTKKMEE